MITAFHSSSFDLQVALRLYDRLSELPVSWFAASRLKLPCIIFKFPSFSSYRTGSGHVYRADTLAFGMVEIKTRYNLSGMNSLYLVHPWLDTLLEREGMQSGISVEDDGVLPPSPDMDDNGVPPPSPDMDDGEIYYDAIDGDSSLLAESEPLSIPGPVRMESMDREMRARRLVARLRQPFGALLVKLASGGQRTVDYRRVAADSMITVQFQEIVSLTELLDNVRTIDVL